jgi:hypothetical protein
MGPTIGIVEAGSNVGDNVRSRTRRLLRAAFDIIEGRNGRSAKGPLC